MGLNFFETNWSPSLPHRIYLVPIRFKAFQVFLFFYTASYVWLSGSLERGREESCKEKCQINYAVAAETSLVRILSIHQLLTSGNAKPTESSLARPFLSRLQMSAVDILSNVDKYQIIASYPVSEANIQENLISKNYKNVDQSVSLAAKGIVNVNFHPSLCFLEFFFRNCRCIECSFGVSAA